MCNCCFVCGQREGERCYNETLNQLPSYYKRYGPCGEGLECKVRLDLEPTDLPEAICYCSNSKPVCGSDGVTYETECQLTEARYEKRDGLVAESRGPCKSGYI